MASPTVSRWALALVLVGCGPASVDPEPGEGSSESGDYEPVCEGSWSSAPTIVAETTVPHHVHRVAGSSSGLYGVGTTAGDDNDWVVWRFSDHGSVSWTARWGHPYGWSDLPQDLLATSDGVLVAGRAAVYEGQEFWSAGHAAVRSYSRGGVLRWSWEDTSGITLNADVSRPRMLAADDDAVFVAISAHDERDVVRVVRLSPEGMEEHAWQVDVEDARAQLLALHLDDAGDPWVLVDAYQPWLGHWTRDGAFVESFSAEVEPGLSAGAFFADGSVVVAGEAGNDALFLARFGPQLTDPRTSQSSGDFGGLWSHRMEISGTCEGTALVGSADGGFPQMGFDADAAQLWQGESWFTAATAPDGRGIASRPQGPGGSTVAWLQW